MARQYGINARGRVLSNSIMKFLETTPNQTVKQISEHFDKEDFRNIRYHVGRLFKMGYIGSVDLVPEVGVRRPQHHFFKTDKQKLEQTILDNALKMLND